MRWLTCFLECFFMLPLEPLVEAAFLDKGATARSAALGGSYVALADDSGALGINPAGLGSDQRAEIMTDYSRLTTGLSDGSQIAQSYLGGAYPLSIGGTLAGSWKQLDFDGLYRERVIAVGYGRWWTSRFAFGAAVKQLHLSYNPPDTWVDDFGNIQSGAPDLFAKYGTSRSAYSADIGALYKASTHTTLALAIQDINEPNVALSDSDRDIVARTIRMGIAYEPQPDLHWAMSLHTRESLEDQRDWIWTGGAEKYWMENPAGQLGCRGSIALGSRQFRQGAVGLSYGIGALRFDYAYSINFSGMTFGSTTGDHRVSANYRFGKSNQPVVVLKKQDTRHVEVDFVSSLLPYPMQVR